MLLSRPRVFPVNESLPPGEAHAVSVSMPTWTIVNEYVHKTAKPALLTRGYPRIFIHQAVIDLGVEVVARCGREGTNCLPFPTAPAACRCIRYLRSCNPDAELEILPFKFPGDIRNENFIKEARWTEFFAVLYPDHLTKAGRDYWRYSGEGISSRQSKLIQDVFPMLKSPRDAQHTIDHIALATVEALASVDIDNGKHAGQAISAFIAETTSSDTVHVETTDVLLYPTGMCAIYHTAMALKKVSLADRTNSATMFGFPYTDTVKLLQKVVWTDCDFFGRGDAIDLDMLELKLASGRKIGALFCEFPSNPLLRTVDLARIHSLAKAYGFMIACDDTVGTFVNVDLLPYVDVLMTSLTKIASGVGNAMGGSIVVSPFSQQHDAILAALATSYEDIYFPQDMALMARNCVDMVPRVHRANETAAVFAEWFTSQPPVKDVYYPSLVSSKKYYERCLKSGGGYGYLLSVVFHSNSAASAFYDGLDVAKGPSLGFNFTLATAYTLLGHHDELEWAGQLGVPEFLVRVSFGLEEQDILFPIFSTAMESAVAAIAPKNSL